MGEQSLQDVMNTVARQLDALVPQQGRSGSRDTLGELEIFASLDPLLGDLQRQYNDARYTRRTQEKMFGTDDPMGDVARDMEDSAWCAMQTRYMEVRGDRGMMREVQAIQNEQRDRDMRAKERDAANDSIRAYYQADMMARMKRQSKTPSIFEWLVVMWLLNRTGQSFSISPGFARYAA